MQLDQTNAVHLGIQTATAFSMGVGFGNQLLRQLFGARPLPEMNGVDAWPHHCDTKHGDIEGPRTRDIYLLHWSLQHYQALVTHLQVASGASSSSLSIRSSDDPSCLPSTCLVILLYDHDHEPHRRGEGGSRTNLE